MPSEFTTPASKFWQAFQSLNMEKLKLQKMLSSLPKSQELLMGTQIGNIGATKMICIGESLH